ncbi:hypothetical protein K505DRAFT_373039 [Melanomma pulvis-pyrius CBS 109.77]|uniref:Uncharacterized protein n=1 Tax=Melanomma pulvis-pyrius CBS 109.77 TaxID=1314802 RepID=A0A6A6XK65_9PLEO|nr:hypothetical protein K505DRAFT_373039 [Melanomma pulvis-pyrius CBS 109.77]
MPPLPELPVPVSDTIAVRVKSRMKAREIPTKKAIDLPTYRDVGVVFTEPGYTGSARFIIESKGKPECLPLKPGPDVTRIGSLMVCRDTACTFFTGNNCDESDPDNFSVRVHGPGDVPNLNTPAGNVFQQVCCGQDLEETQTGTQGAASKADFVVIPEPHVNTSSATIKLAGKRANKRMANLMGQS